MRPPTRIAALLLLTFSLSTRAQSQVTETPVPFDSARRVMTMTETLVERLHLSAPAWPVTGAFREARLFSVQPGGGFVLVVPRPSGATDRFTLTDDERTRLGNVIDAAMAANGRPSPESGSGGPSG